MQSKNYLSVSYTIQKGEYCIHLALCLKQHTIRAINNKNEVEIIDQQDGQKQDQPAWSINVYNVPRRGLIR